MIFLQENLREFKEYFKDSKMQQKKAEFNHLCKMFSELYEADIENLENEYEDDLLLLDNELLALKLEARKSVKILMEGAKELKISDEFVDKTLVKYDLKSVLKN